MTDIQQMLERQALWQRSRQNLSWPEKIRMAERVRDSIVPLRAMTPSGARPQGARLLCEKGRAEATLER
jgi:hypothetical protein